MSTSSITPEQSSLASAVPTSAPNNYVEQSSQNPAPEQGATPPPAPAVGPRLASALSAIVGTTQPQTPPATPSPSSGGVASGPDDADFNTASGSGGWKGALGKVASVISTGLSGIPAGARPSFAGGLGQGARAENAAQAAQQDIKFKDFDTQVRLANLHNQDQELQLRTQEQQDAHQKAQDAQADYDEDHGISFDPHPNDGKAVLDTLQGQTQANGAAEVPPGTHLSADGKTVNVPDNSQETQAGLLQKYKDLQGPLSLPALPQNAQFVPGRNLDVMTHKLGGYKADGSPWGHDDLPGQISSLQSQRDALAKSGANPYQLQTLDNTLNIYKSNLDALDKHAASVAGQKSQATEAGKIAAQNSPEGRSLSQSNEKLAEQKQDNAASDRPTKPQNVDSNGNPVWVPGVSADEKKKAELSENVVFNSNNIASILQRRPDLVGKLAGRVTSLDQLAGTNDPDITSLGQDMHNIAIANVGIHGMRANDAVHDVEKNILNNFKNGPQAIGGALQSTAKSVQTFIDNARPDTYKTHSKNGGAMRAMVPQQGQQ
jgi:hypothetical protein